MIRHWHGLVMCDVLHPGGCDGEWGCECPKCRDRKHPMDLMARYVAKMREQEKK